MSFSWILLSSLIKNLDITLGLLSLPISIKQGFAGMVLRFLSLILLNIKRLMHFLICLLCISFLFLCVSTFVYTIFLRRNCFIGFIVSSKNRIWAFKRGFHIGCKWSIIFIFVLMSEYFLLWLKKFNVGRGNLIINFWCRMICLLSSMHC